MTPALGPTTKALEVVKDKDLSGKTALVTGGNSGIGTETARALSAAGCNVYITSRQKEAGEQAVQYIRKKHKEDGFTEKAGSVEAVALDLTSLPSIKACAQEVAGKAPVLDYLVCNAGIMACPRLYTGHGLEMQIGTNHFGHFALVTQLLEQLTAQGAPCRVVVVSSLAHSLGSLDLSDICFTRGRKYTPFGAYGQSKLANILFARELNKRCADTNIKAYSLHPGSIKTNLQRHLKGLMAVALNLVMSTPLIRLVGEPAKTPEQGASTSVWACVAPELESQGGAYLSHCQVAPTKHKQAEDPELPGKLWELSE